MKVTEIFAKSVLSTSQIYDYVGQPLRGLRAWVTRTGLSTHSTIKGRVFGIEMPQKQYLRKRSLCALASKGVTVNSWIHDAKNFRYWPVGWGCQRQLCSTPVRRNCLWLNGCSGESRLAGLGRYAKVYIAALRCRMRNQRAYCW